MTSKEPIFFIKVTAEYIPKNKLQKILKEKISELDHTVTQEYSKAFKLLMEAYNIAHEECTTKCKPVQYSTTTEDDVETFYFGVIVVAIYRSKRIIL